MSLVGDLGDKAPGLEFLVNLHVASSPLLCFRNEKRPRPGGDRGRKHSRYHLWFAVFSRTRPHGVPTHSRAVTGAPGARLLGVPSVRAPAPRGICRPPPSPFHQPGALFAKDITGTGPFHRCEWYCSRRTGDCQYKLAEICLTAYVTSIRKIEWENRVGVFPAEPALVIFPNTCYDGSIKKGGPP